MMRSYRIQNPFSSFPFYPHVLFVQTEQRKRMENKPLESHYSNYIQHAQKREKVRFQTICGGFIKKKKTAEV